MPCKFDDTCNSGWIVANRLVTLFSYGSATTSRNALQELNSQTVTKLQDWKENLPVELRVDLDNRETTYLPHVILLQ
jgi:hypothetical protein